MPGRATARSTRTSAASTRKASSGTTRSTRASTNVVEIPDEGESTSLRTQIAQIFDDAQKTTATQRKLVNNLRKVQEACCFAPPTTKKKGGKKNQVEADDNEFVEEDFNNEITRCMLRMICIKKGEPIGDRLIRFLCLFLKYAEEKDQAIYANGEDDEEEAVQTPSYRLLSQLLTAALGFLNAKDKTTRYRSTQIVQSICNTLETIDDDLFNLTRLGLSKRLRDKESSVRVQAARGTHRLSENNDEEQDDEDSDDEFAGSLLDKLSELMVHDPSAEVRKAVLTNLTISPSTLPYILERARDMDPSIRRIVYAKILPALGDFRHMSMTNREQILRWGLRDRDDIVRKSTAQLFSNVWMEDVASSRDTRPEEQRDPDGVTPPDLHALCELLERVDVILSSQEGGMAHEAMREFWALRPDYIEYLQFDEEFWSDLGPYTTFIVRTLNDYVKDAKDDQLLDAFEEKMPDITTFGFFLRKELNALVELVQTHAAMDEDDPDMDETQERLEDQDFVVQQLLHIAQTLDYADEVGRIQIFNLMREAIARSDLPEVCTSLAIEVLRIVCGESEFCAVIVEAIAEVKDTITDSDDEGTVVGEDDEESFHSAQSDVQENDALAAKKAKRNKELTEEERVDRENSKIEVHEKCLHIVQCTLQNVQCDIESNASLTNLLPNLIIPAVQERLIPIRERGIICLGLAALLSQKLASANFGLFLHCLGNGHDKLKEISIQVITDILITHPQLVTPALPASQSMAEDTETIPDEQLKQLTKMLMKIFNSDNKRLSWVACRATMKLLLMGVLPLLQNVQILKNFTIKYFDPETARNPTLRQGLSYFLPVFCHSKLKNTRLMAQISIPVLSKLVLWREENMENEEGDDMVSWPVITAHFADWTDGRKVVGATQLGLDGKDSTTAEAEGVHIQLAISVLERSLGSTCSKEERKVLLSLLTKLYIAPTSNARHGEGERDDEDLRTLHALVAEAVEGKIGTDATQRNALAKLEISLTKRLGEVELVTQVQDSATPEATVAAEEGETEAEDEVTQVPARATTEDTDMEDAEDDTMMAGIHDEGTRMPLEVDDDDEDEDEDEEEEEDSTLLARARRARPPVTEDDIMEDLLQSEME